MKEQDGIISDYLYQIRRLYGDEITDHSTAFYSDGWFYIGIAKRYKDGSVGNSNMFLTPYRKNKVLEMIDRLKERPGNVNQKEASHEP